MPATRATALHNTNLGTTHQAAGPGPDRRRRATLTGAWQFVLDGRWLHAFNGPGMTTNAVYANFRFNKPFVGPNTAGMDEDYDAADLENWFLAMQSADGSVIIPSFHRPAAIRMTRR